MAGSSIWVSLCKAKWALAAAALVETRSTIANKTYKLWIDFYTFTPLSHWNNLIRDGKKYATVLYYNYLHSLKKVDNFSNLINYLQQNSFDKKMFR